MIKIKNWKEYGFVVANKEDIEMGKTVNDLCREAYQTAMKNGFHSDPVEMGTKLALIHSEVSEALEADRKGDYDNFVEELADVCIRVFDLCGAMGIDLGNAIDEKMEVNKGRGWKHGKKY